jgi:hygromycin-B 4-O-kinase
MSQTRARPSDPASIAAFLRERLGINAVDVTELVPGEWSQAFAYRHDGRNRVVRISGLQEAFLKDERAVRYASGDLPIPRVVEVGPVGDGFYAISEWLSGDVLETIDADRLRAVLPSLLLALDSLRVADVRDTRGHGGWGPDGVGGYPSWRAMLLDAATDHPTRHTHGWRARLAASDTGDEPFLEAYAVLTSLVDHISEERHLVHADLMNRNVLVAGNRISGILDWGCAMYGDFLMDLAWIDFWAPWSPGWEEVDIVAAGLDHYRAIGLDVPNFAERLRACQIYIGLDGQAYQAHKGQWAEVERTAARTLEIARG